MLNTNEMNKIALRLMPVMRGMFAKLCPCEADIDDAVQDGYLFLVSYCLPRWTGVGSVDTFALQGVKRRYYNDRKAHRNSKRESFPEADSEVYDDGSANARLRCIEAQWLTDALKYLTGRERALCEAFQLHGEWRLAADEIGVSAVMACRMKMRIKEQLTLLE